jgi:hypothetical protein
MRTQVNARSTVGLVREPLILEARESSNLFNIVKSVNYLKEFCIPLSVIMGVDHHLLANDPFQVNGRSNVALERDTLKLEARRSTTLFSIVN